MSWRPDPCDPSAYPTAEDPPERWQWEFLRRNQSYQEVQPMLAILHAKALEIGVPRLRAPLDRTPLSENELERQAVDKLLFTKTLPLELDHCAMHATGYPCVATDWPVTLVFDATSDRVVVSCVDDHAEPPTEVSITSWQKHEAIALFDLRKPLVKQLDTVRQLLKEKQSMLRREAKPQARTYPNMLRLLDVLAANPAATNKEIAAIVAPESPPENGEDYIEKLKPKALAMANAGYLTHF